jgi:lipopolysaccharide transport system ATP-binding protein
VNRSLANISIYAENLGKRYRIGQREPYKTLRDTLTNAFHLRSRFLKKGGDRAQGDGKYIWALKDISFEIKYGEVVGIIGRNGAGKTTLLKIFSRITEPTEGYAEINGRVGSLLEVGTGFHPELTGRENIYLNGAILGMKKVEIKKKFDEIVDFSEVEKFIDTPVKYYSSGMYVRLAFAVAAHLEPEVLLVDEVLAVGDAAFQKKCLGKMSDVAKEGRTVLFVSHNMAAIQTLCSKGCLLDNGRIILQGEVEKVISFYLNKSQDSVKSVSLADRADRQGNGSLRFTGVTLLSKGGEVIISSRSGEDLIIALEYIRPHSSKARAEVRLAFSNEYGQRLFICRSNISHSKNLELPVKGQIRCRINRLPLIAGRYIISVFCKINGLMADNLQDAFDIEVIDGDFFGTGKINAPDGGNLLVEHTWEVL